MNVTLTLDDDLVKKVRKIAVDRDTTLTGMIREYLKTVAAEETVREADRRRQALEKLERSFQELSFRVGKITWTRAELHERPRRGQS
jgi:predicted transcriptional regulator